MKATTTNIIDLNGYKNRRDIIEKVIQQTNKDLELEIELDLLKPEAELYDCLVSQLQPVIGKLIYQGGGKVDQMLYKIDVSEYRVKEALQTAQDTDPAIIFTHLIIERELQKVVFKMIYSNGLSQ